MNAMEKMAAQEAQAVRNSWRTNPVIPSKVVDAVRFYGHRPSKGFMGSVVLEVAEKTGVTPKQILGSSRKRNIVRARQLAMWGARQHGVSFPEIGRFFNRDHTTVIHGVKMVENLIEAYQ